MRRTIRTVTPKHDNVFDVHPEQPMSTEDTRFGAVGLVPGFLSPFHSYPFICPPVAGSHPLNHNADLLSTIDAWDHPQAEELGACKPHRLRAASNRPPPIACTVGDRSTD